MTNHRHRISATFAELSSRRIDPRNLSASPIRVTRQLDRDELMSGAKKAEGAQCEPLPLQRRRPDSNRGITDLQSVALGRLATAP